jgi:uncharacterized DUF497 family protein
MIYVEHVIWLPQFEDKLLAKHHVTVREAEDILFGVPYIEFAECGVYTDEHLYAAYRQTHAGRYLVVLFVMKQGGGSLVISARDMDGKERRRYGRRK